jgi:signal transduction histidine kinase
MVNAFHTGRDGRLWIATSGAGLMCVDNPAADHPTFRSLNRADGLSGNDIYAIVEDHSGRLYAATAQGIDRLDANGRFIRTFTAADGLATGRILDARVDPAGDLWVATATGVSRLTPRPDSPVSPPVVRLSAFRVEGRPMPVSQAGDLQVGPFEFPPGEDQIEVEFLAVDLRPGARLRFQTALGGNSPVWSPPSQDRVVNFSRLAPGSYVFQVRAVNEAGLTSPEPARVQFRILAPVWQRWWFLLLVTCVVVSAAYSLHRYRIRRELALQAMRTRISADLHDDIGSSLSRVVLLSEVAKSRIPNAPADAARLLEDIASTGREVLDGMSDIVWAVDPRRDQVEDLATRIRDYAGTVLDESGIAWTLDTGGTVAGLQIQPDQRRHVYLVFKEAIRNAMRHSGCSHLKLALRCTRSEITGEIADDGKGITAERRAGNGLINMRSRVEALGGEWNLSSTPGQGTVISFRIPAAAATKTA